MKPAAPANSASASQPDTVRRMVSTLMNIDRNTGRYRLSSAATKASSTFSFKSLSRLRDIHCRYAGNW